MKTAAKIAGKFVEEQGCADMTQVKRLIRASAGSGKTFQLSVHFLRQLFLGHRPETILATTFTRKAAGEIQGRVLLRLADAASNPAEAKSLSEFVAPAKVTTETAKALLADLTRHLHRLRVCTLDSFFQQVARSLTLELGLTPGWSILDDHTDAELREQAIDAVLSQQMPQDAQQLMHMLAKGRSKRSVRDLINDTVSQFHELYLQTSPEAWEQLPRHHRLTQDQRAISLHHVEGAPLPDDKRAAAAKTEDLARFCSDKWQDFLTRGIAGKLAAGETSFYKKDLPDELIEAYEPLISHARAEIIDQLVLRMKGIRNLISRFDTEYRRLRDDRGWLKFGDVTRVLAQSVNAATGHRMNFRLDSTIRNLLLDEFQDTSADQWQILRRLEDSLQNHDESSFFCVGDDKQAIYGWRGGVADILEEVRTSVGGIETTPLDMSRRSSSAVIETVNKVFQNIKMHNNLGEYKSVVIDWSSRFPVHSTAKSKMPGYTCFRTSPEFEGDSSDEKKAQWFRWVAEQIRDLHTQTPGAEIGVLTRKNGSVARLVHELSLLDVRASEEGGTPPTDSPAVLALLSLLHLASHPGCKVSQYHVALSPFGPIVGLTAWDDLKLATDVAAGIRARLMDDGYGKTLQWLSESVRPHCNARDVLRLQQVVSEGWRFDATPSLNSADFVRLLENSKYQKSEPAPVRVMTIHQSKGLEFDIVVLPELKEGLFRSPPVAFTGPSPVESPDRVCVWANRDIWPVFPKPIQEAFRDSVDRLVSESLCVFYVALTRAKHSMHLLSEPMTSDKVPRDFAGLLLASLGEKSTAEPSTTIFEEGNAEWYLDVPEMLDENRHAKKSSLQAPRISLSPMRDGRRRGLRRRAPSRHDETTLYLPDVTKAIARRENPGQGAYQFSRPEVDARTRGTVMHAWFECIEWLDAGAIPDERFLMRRAEQLSVPDAISRKLLPEFLRMLQNPETRHVFDRNRGGECSVFRPHLDAIASGQATLRVERERSFVLLQSGELVQGTIDRLVLLSVHGRLVAADVVDFKTDRFAGERHAWIEARRAHYGPQLHEYRNAVMSCFGLGSAQISTRLLLLEADAVVEC